MQQTLPPLRGAPLAVPPRVRRLGPGARHLASLVSGSALGQGLTVAAAPVLTRLYGPADFGLLAVYASLLGTLSVVACARYELAVTLARTRREAAHVLALALVAALGTGALTALGVALLGGTVARAVGAPALAALLWLLPLSLVGLASLQALGYWAARSGGYGRVARARLVQGLSQAVAQLGLGALGLAPAGLVVGDVVGRAGGLAGLAGGAVREARVLARHLRWTEVVRAARRYRRFPLVGGWGALFNVLALEAPVFLLAVFYSPRETGGFALVQRLLAVPLALLGQAVGLYYVGEGTRRLRLAPGALAPFFRRTVGRLALWAGLPLLLLGLLAPRVVPWAFGAAWQEAGRYAVPLAVVAAAQLTAVPVSQTLGVLERQGLQLAWDLGRLVLVASALGAAGALGATALQAVVAYAAAMVLAYLALLALIAHALRAPAPRAGPPPGAPTAA